MCNEVLKIVVISDNIFESYKIIKINYFLIDQAILDNIRLNKSNQI